MNQFQAAKAIANFKRHIPEQPATEIEPCIHNFMEKSRYATHEVILHAVLL